MTNAKSSKGPHLGYRIFYLAIRWLGPGFAYLMLAFVIPYFVIFSPRARRSTYTYLDHLYKGQSRAMRLLYSFRYLYEFGLVLIDQAAMSILGPERFHIVFPQKEELYSLARESNGLVLVTSHIGSWQTAIAALSNLPVPVHLIFRVDERSQGRHVFDVEKQFSNFHIIDPNSYFGGMIDAMQALERGHCVATMGDRAQSARVRWKRLLGVPAPFSLTPYYLAHRMQVPCCVLLVARTGKMAMKMQFKEITRGLEDEQDLEYAITEMLSRYIDCIEELLKEYPYTWFNFTSVEEARTKQDQP